LGINFGVNGMEFGTTIAPVTLGSTKITEVEAKPSTENMKLTTSLPAVANEVAEILKTVYSKKPKTLVMEELTWKFLVHNVLRGKNILMTGPTGCGKTIAVKAIAEIFPERELFIFNMGATQDPKSFLIGNTHFDKDKGTYFARSEFVKAIQTKNSIVLLDELSRAHPDAGNILMSVLDSHQRYLRLDEADDCAKINVAEGVSFLGTANIGNEYTGTRVQDRALMDRFQSIEMKPLTAIEEHKLLKMMFKEVDEKVLKSVAEIAGTTRKEVKNEESKISTILSTRGSVEIAELLRDGFTLIEAAEVKIYPLFPDEGGADSERTFIKQVVQKYIVVETPEGEEPKEDADLFNVGDDELPDTKPF